MIDEDKKRRRVKLVVQIFSAMLAVAFCVLLSIVMLRFVSETEQMEAWMGRHPYMGRLVYVGMSMLQVLIALIPGEPVEIAGGYVFGTVEGTVLYLIGATLGSLTIFMVVRRFGSRLLEFFFSKEKIKSLRFLQNSGRRNILLSFIFILPGTPKDLLCYFAGLTDIKLKVWFWICSMGRLPSVITSMLSGNALETKSYGNAIVVFIVTIFISLLGVLIYKGICEWHNNKQRKVIEELNAELRKQE